VWGEVMSFSITIKSTWIDLRSYGIKDRDLVETICAAIQDMDLRARWFEACRRCGL
jgi:hypothetical protein